MNGLATGDECRFIIYLCPISGLIKLFNTCYKDIHDVKVISCYFVELKKSVKMFKQCSSFEDSIPFCEPREKCGLGNEKGRLINYLSIYLL